MSEVDIAWAAGFFEGEGHVKYTTRKSDKSSWFSIEVAQVYREPLDKLQALFGGKVYGPYGPYGTNKQPYYMFIAYGQMAFDAVEQMRPYLFRKGEQVDAALNKVKERNAERERKSTSG